MAFKNRDNYIGSGSFGICPEYFQHSGEMSCTCDTTSVEDGYFR